MISKRTKVFATLVVLCGIIFLVSGYGYFRQLQAFRAEWRGQEQMLEYMDIYPHAHPVARLAFFAGMFSILATAASLGFDIRRNRLKA